MITLTRVNTGAVVYVNADRIVKIETSANGATVVVLAGAETLTLYVNEPPHDVVQLINEAP